jgi:hypothetical protein
MPNDTKMKEINHGHYFINNQLIRDFIRSRIDKKPDGDEKDYLIYKWEEGKVFPSEETPNELITSICDSPEQRNALKNRLHAIKIQINLDNKADKEKIGSYFFISAVISLINLAIPVLEKKEGSSNLLETLYPFVSDAVTLSSKIKCRVPKMPRDVFINMNSDELKKNMEDWQSNLEKAATRLPLIPLIDDSIIIKPQVLGIGLDVKKIVRLCRIPQ